MAEEPLPPNGSCLLGSINLSAFVKNKEFQFNEFERAIRIAVIALNEVLDDGLPLHPLEAQKHTVRDWRQIGLGIMGLADMLILMGIKYGSKESLDFCGELARFMANITLDQSANIASKLGHYPKFDLNTVLKSSYIKNNASSKTIENIKKHGLRNSQLLTIAPTGSISTMIQVSGGIEPIFAMKYTRTTKSLDNKDKVFDIYTKIAADWFENNPNESKLPDYFVESGDLDPKDRVLMQSVFQQSIDASISSTVNLKSSATKDDVYNIYMNAWKHKLKGITVFRENCKRKAILSTSNDQNNSEELIHKAAVKRPRILNADYYEIKAKGEDFIVIVGLLNKKPYEIFAMPNNDRKGIKSHSGFITKNKKKDYSFNSELCNIKNLVYEGDDEKDFVTICLMTSQLLRHGVGIEHIIHTLKKTNAYMGSFVNAIIRVLGRYDNSVKKEICPECGNEITHEGGCVQCKNCGWSRCNMSYLLKYNELKDKKKFKKYFINRLVKKYM